VPADSEVAVRWKNLIGQRFLDIRPGDAPDRLGDGDEVAATRSVVDIGELVNRLGPLARAVDPAQLNQLLAALAEALEGRGDDMGELVHGVDAVLATLAERDQTISQLLTDYATVTDTLARRDAQVRQVVDDLVLLSQAFADNTDLLDRALVELGGFSEGLAAVLEDDAAGLGRTVDDLAVVTGTASAHIDELELALASLPAAVRDLFDASDEGELITVLTPCLTTGPPPCPYPMIGPQGPR
jgi:phospholipid/cholesterol/gamma-HCH transport system substrate-binding protein